MRVTFKEGTLDDVHKEGLLKKVHTTYYTIDTSVQFTEEEKSIIGHYDLGHYIIMSHARDATWIDQLRRLEHDKPNDVATIVMKKEPEESYIAIRQFLNGAYRYIGHNPYEIVLFRRQMTDALHKTKRFIMAMVEQREAPDTFDID